MNIEKKKHTSFLTVLLVKFDTVILRKTQVSVFQKNIYTIPTCQHEVICYLSGKYLIGAIEGKIFFPFRTYTA